MSTGINRSEDRLFWYKTELDVKADMTTHKPLTYGQRLHRRSYLAHVKDMEKPYVNEKIKRYEKELRTNTAPNGKPLTYGQRLFRSSYLSHEYEMRGFEKRKEGNYE